MFNLFWNGDHLLEKCSTKKNFFEQESQETEAQTISQKKSQGTHHSHSQMPFTSCLKKSILFFSSLSLLSLSVLWMVVNTETQLVKGQRINAWRVLTCEWISIFCLLP